MGDLGSYLKELRQRKGWTLRVAAAEIGISASRLTELEAGRSYRTTHKTRPSPDVVERLAAAYGLDPSHLLAEAGYDVGPLAKLGPQEQRLLSIFAGLSDQRKAIGLQMMRVLAETKLEDE